MDENEQIQQETQELEDVINSLLDQGLNVILSREIPADNPDFPEGAVAVYFTPKSITELLDFAPAPAAECGNCTCEEKTDEAAVE